MPSVFMVRHQAAGFITSCVFLSPPNELQLASLRKECERLHGTSHPQTREPYWLRVIEIPCLDAQTIPHQPANAGMSSPMLSGVGAVIRG